MKLNRRQLRRLIESALNEGLTDQQVQQGYMKLGKELVDTVNKQINQYLEGPDDKPNVKGYGITYVFPGKDDTLNRDAYKEIKIKKPNDHEGLNDFIEETAAELAEKYSEEDWWQQEAKDYPGEDGLEIPVDFSLPKYVDTKTDF